MQRVILFSGHMIDSPDRDTPRFPASMENAASARIAAILEGWRVGKNDICICGGARGGDILFAEHGLDRGAQVRLFLPLEKEAFLDASVRLPPVCDSGWENRFADILGRSTAVWPDPDSTADASENPFAKNNTRMIAAAKTCANGGPIHLLLLWNGQGGDGDGGTADVAHRVEGIAAKVAIIDPTKLH